MAAEGYENVVKTEGDSRVPPVTSSYPENSDRTSAGDQASGLKDEDTVHGSQDGVDMIKSEQEFLSSAGPIMAEEIDHGQSYQRPLQAGSTRDFQYASGHNTNTDFILASHQQDALSRDRSVAIFLQPACKSHKWIRTNNTDHVFERPERLRAVTLGIAAFVARREEELELGLDRLYHSSGDVNTSEGPSSNAEAREKISKVRDAERKWAKVERENAAVAAHQAMTTTRTTRTKKSNTAAATSAMENDSPVALAKKEYELAIEDFRRVILHQSLSRSQSDLENSRESEIARSMQSSSATNPTFIRPDLSNLMNTLALSARKTDGKTRADPDPNPNPHGLAPRPRVWQTPDSSLTAGTWLAPFAYLAPIMPPRQAAPESINRAPSESLSLGQSPRSTRARPIGQTANQGGPGSVLTRHPAVQYSHSDPTHLRAPFPPYSEAPDSSDTSKASSSRIDMEPPRPEYLRELLRWSLDAPQRIKERGCEIPDREGMNTNDLYLGPGSVDAMEGCITTVCQAVDLVFRDASVNQPHAPLPTPLPRQSFCAIRPPGHHCGQDTPSGFCYINNAVVGAMHAYLQHDCDRAIILDFDLHHGNGTQSIVMGLNDVSRAHALSNPPPEPGQRRTWQGFYGSLHDIAGDLDLIKDASVQLAAHGQYIHNIHLKTYNDEADFYSRLYPEYLRLLAEAQKFLEETEADPSRTLILISAGFDACEHEYEEMQRHGRRVPASFFSRFTADVVKFSEARSFGRIVSVLEGGYSDMALTSGAMSHLFGFVRDPAGEIPMQSDAMWQLASATPRKRGGELAAMPEDVVHRAPYLRRTWEVMNEMLKIESPPIKVSKPATPLAALPHTMRTRSAVNTPEMQRSVTTTTSHTAGGGDADDDLASALAGMKIEKTPDRFVAKDMETTPTPTPGKQPKLVFTFKKDA